MTGDENPPKPFSQVLSAVAIHLAERWNVSPFDVLEKDIDDFILIVNSLNWEKNATGKNDKIENNKAVSKKNDGFWDM